MLSFGMNVMRISLAKPRRAVVCSLLTVAVISGSAVTASAQVVPGTGAFQAKASDNFEDEKWSFNHNFPKSSNNLDNMTRYPSGQSNNGIWFESLKRGQPDVVKRVPTPPGGRPGSKGALLMQTLNSGVPGRTSSDWQQDDLLVDVTRQLGGSLPVSWSPNVVTRVYLPDFEQWENRTGASFGFRASVVGQRSTRTREKKGLFGFVSRIRNKTESETLYPGMFIQFNSKTAGYPQDSAHFIIRADERGYDYTGPVIKQTGWWTLGMSFTGDGRIHYYAKPGTGNLTHADHIASHHYGDYTVVRFNTYFFDVCNANNGRSWSTPWVIDDTELYISR